MSKKTNPLILVLISFVLHSCAPTPQNNSNVKFAGAMKNVMRMGQLYGTIDLDTISNKQHLYGLGPLEYLRGELLVIDGKSYVSTVLTDSTMLMEETYKVKAPFFVYTNVETWKEQPLPAHIETIKQLEAYLDQITKSAARPFAFKLVGMVQSATIHILNLPEGTEVHSHEDGHKGQKKYNFKDENVELIGFFSTEHQGVFTHHDSFLHIHLITSDHSEMGHLEDAILKKGTFKLYLPIK